MEQQRFLDNRQRRVTIKITEDKILFIHDNSEEEFYCIPKDYWRDDATQRQDREDNFHRHMKEKIWFTKGMYDFINKSCAIKKNYDEKRSSSSQY